MQHPTNDVGGPLGGAFVGGTPIRPGIAGMRIGPTVQRELHRPPQTRRMSTSDRTWDSAAMESAWEETSSIARLLGDVALRVQHSWARRQERACLDCDWSSRETRHCRMLRSGTNSRARPRTRPAGNSPKACNTLGRRRRQRTAWQAPGEKSEIVSRRTLDAPLGRAVAQGPDSRGRAVAGAGLANQRGRQNSGKSA